MNVVSAFAAIALGLIAVGCMDARRGGASNTAASDTTAASDATVSDSADSADSTATADSADGSATADSADGTGTADGTDASAPDTTVDTTGQIDSGIDTTVADTSDRRSCACDHGADCSAPCPDDGQVCAREGYPDELALYTCRPPAGLGEGCTNQFNEYRIPCAPGLSCLVPDPNEPDTSSRCYDCRAQDAAGVGGCEMEIGVFFDGTRCVSISGCSCAGVDCDSPYPSIATCQSHTATPCSALLGP